MTTTYLTPDLSLHHHEVPLFRTAEAGYFDRVNFRYLAKRMADLGSFIEFENYRAMPEWQEAQAIGSMGLQHFRENHPGMGDREHQEFGEILVQFAFGATRLAKIDSNATAVTELRGPSLTAFFDDVIELYLPVVRSRELVAAETALGEYLNFVDAQTAIGQPNIAI